MAIGNIALMEQLAYYTQRHQKALARNYIDQASGQKYQNVAENPVAFALQAKITSQINTSDNAQSTLNQASTVVQLGESSLGTISDLIQQIRDNAVQSLSADDSTRSTLNTQVAQLTAQISSYLKSTTYNGQNILSAGAQFQWLESNQVNSLSTLDLSDTSPQSALLYNATFYADAVADPAYPYSYANFDVSTTANASATMASADIHLQQLTLARSVFGQWQNRFENSIDTLSTTDLALSALQSASFDSDYATLSADTVRNNILLQSATALQAQAKATAELVIDLLKERISA